MAAAAATRGAATVLLLCGSNAFMVTAWNLHLKIKSWPMVTAIFLSWLIAFFEYCLQVPANRLGHVGQGGPFTAPQLKIIQEFISLTAFGIFSILFLKENLGRSDLLAFGFIFMGVAVGLLGKSGAPQAAAANSVAALPLPPALPQPAGQRLGEGRKLLELLPLMGGSSGGSSGGRQQHDAQQQQQQQHAEAHSSYQLLSAPLPQEEEEALHSESSTAVLLADDVEVHASSGQQRVYRREHTLEPEADTAAVPATAGAEAAARQAGSAPVMAHQMHAE